MLDPETGEYVAAFETFRITWQTIEVEIRFERNFLTTGTARLEIESIAPARAPLPLTETGYLSHFTRDTTIDDADGPVAYVVEALDEAAKSKEWRTVAQAQRQLSLF